MASDFETDPRDHPAVQLGGNLLEHIAPPFNDWITTMALSGQQPIHVVNAVITAFAALVSTVVEHTAKPDQRAKLLGQVGKGIGDRALALWERENARKAAEEPDESIH